MKGQNLLTEHLESIRRDVGLIIDDVNRADSYAVFSCQRERELKYALNGMNTVLRDLKKLRDSTAKALSNQLIKNKYLWKQKQYKPFVVTRQTTEGKSYVAHGRWNYYEHRN